MSEIDWHFRSERERRERQIKDAITLLKETGVTPDQYRQALEDLRDQTRDGRRRDAKGNDLPQ